MSLVDSAMTREVVRDISKRPLDISDLHVNVMHGVVYLRGKVDLIKGYHAAIDLREEVHRLIKMLRQKSGIRDVVCEVEYGGIQVVERPTQQRIHHSYFR